MSGIGPVQSMHVYVGASGDYFDFRSDNKLYIDIVFSIVRVFYNTNVQQQKIPGDS